jgi:hypothetical protein
MSLCKGAVSSRSGPTSSAGGSTGRSFGLDSDTVAIGTLSAMRRATGFEELR